MSSFEYSNLSANKSIAVLSTDVHPSWVQSSQNEQINQAEGINMLQPAAVNPISQMPGIPC